MTEETIPAWKIDAPCQLGAVVHHKESYWIRTRMTHILEPEVSQRGGWRRLGDVCCLEWDDLRDTVTRVRDRLKVKCSPNS